MTAFDLEVNLFQVFQQSCSEDFVQEAGHHGHHVVSNHGLSYHPEILRPVYNH